MAPVCCCCCCLQVSLHRFISAVTDTTSLPWYLGEKNSAIFYLRRRRLLLLPSLLLLLEILSSLKRALFGNGNWARCLFLSCNVLCLILVACQRSLGINIMIERG